MQFINLEIDATVIPVTQRNALELGGKECEVDDFNENLQPKMKELIDSKRIYFCPDVKGDQKLKLQGTSSTVGVKLIY